MLTLANIYRLAAERIGTVRQIIAEPTKFDFDPMHAICSTAASIGINPGPAIEGFYWLMEDRFDYCPVEERQLALYFAAAFCDGEDA